MHEPSVLSPESHTHAQGDGRRGFERRARERKEISSNSRKKMFGNLHNGTAVRFSPLVLVVSLENAIKIF